MRFDDVMHAATLCWEVSARPVGRQTSWQPKSYFVLELHGQRQQCMHMGASDYPRMMQHWNKAGHILQL